MQCSQSSNSSHDMDCTALPNRKSCGEDLHHFWLSSEPRFWSQSKITLPSNKQSPKTVFRKQREQTQEEQLPLMMSLLLTKRFTPFNLTDTVYTSLHWRALIVVLTLMKLWLGNGLWMIFPWQINLQCSKATDFLIKSFCPNKERRLTMSLQQNN